MASKKRAITKRAKQSSTPAPADVLRRARTTLQQVTNGGEEIMAEAQALAGEADRAVDFARRVGSFFRNVADAAAAKARPAAGGKGERQ